MGFISAGVAEKKLGGVIRMGACTDCRKAIDSGAMGAVRECQLTVSKHAIINARPGQVLECEHQVSLCVRSRLDMGLSHVQKA